MTVNWFVKRLKYSKLRKRILGGACRGFDIPELETTQSKKSTHKWAKNAKKMQISPTYSCGGKPEDSNAYWGFRGRDRSKREHLPNAHHHVRTACRRIQQHGTGGCHHGWFVCWIKILIDGRKVTKNTNFRPLINSLRHQKNSLDRGVIIEKKYYTIFANNAAQ